MKQKAVTAILNFDSALCHVSLQIDIFGIKNTCHVKQPTLMGASGTTLVKNLTLLSEGNLIYEQIYR